MRLSCLVFLMLLAISTFGQQIDMKDFEGLKFRNIGPAGMSGRVTAIDVDLRDKDHIYIGSASGGVWESKNGGITWKPIIVELAFLNQMMGVLLGNVWGLKKQN